MFTITCNNCNESVVVPTIVQIKEKDNELEEIDPNCICAEYDGKSKSTCGIECPIHSTQEYKTISYLDNMTFAEAWQKLIVDAEIPCYEWTDVKSFYPVDKNGTKLEEKPTGKTVTWKTPNVLDCTPEMCGKSADERLREDTEWLPPVAYLHWLSELWKGGKRLDMNKGTIFPDWRNDFGRVLRSCWRATDSQVLVRDFYPDVSGPSVGARRARKD